MKVGATIRTIYKYTGNRMLDIFPFYILCFPLLNERRWMSLKGELSLLQQVPPD
jgi:hypothetical protein